MVASSCLLEIQFPVLRYPSWEYATSNGVSTTSIGTISRQRLDCRTDNNFRVESVGDCFVIPFLIFGARPKTSPCNNNHIHAYLATGIKKYRVCFLFADVMSPTFVTSPRRFAIPFFVPVRKSLGILLRLRAERIIPRSDEVCSIQTHAVNVTQRITLNPCTQCWMIYPVTHVKLTGIGATAGAKAAIEAAGGTIA